MKVDFSQTMKNFDGAVIVEAVPGEENKAVPISLSSIIVNALMATFEDEKNLTGDEKVKRYNLAFLVHNSKDEPVEVSVEDVALMKKLIAKAYGPLFVGQAWNMLEG